MLRSLVRALRGGATRFVGAIKTFGGIFKDGVCTDKRTSDQIQIVSRQVYRFARLRMNDPTIIETCTE